MAWTVVSVESKNSTRGNPTASVGFGRIAINAAACNLIDELEQYNHIELWTDSDRPSVVALKFLREESKNSLPIRRRMSNGKIRGGIDITSKNHMQQLFGIKGTQNKTTPYKIVKEDDDLLIINTN